MNGATLLARTLRLAGIGDDPIFTLSGNQVLPVYEAGLDEGIRFVDTRHESAAAHMADTWGRLTGRPGLCLVTAGPGHTNALTGLATAWMAESPMILFSGGSDHATAGRGGFQEIDQVALARPICKAAWVATSAEEIPVVVAEAYRTTLEGVPGPVHVTLPFDVLNANVEEADAALPTAAEFMPAQHGADAGEVERAVALLSEAERPLLLAGPSSWRGTAGERLRRLLDLTAIPGFPIESPRGLTDPSLHGAATEFSRADAVLLIGPQDFTVGFAGPRVVGEQARLIQLAPTEADLGRNRPIDVGLAGDAQVVFDQLHQAARTRPWRAAAWKDELAEIQAENRSTLERFERSDDAPVHPLRVAAEVRALLEPGDCLTLDGGEFGQWARWGLGGGPYETVVNGKLGGIGGGISFGIAAALARPDRRSVAFVGDGTFGFHAMELDTAVRHRVPFVLVIGNDAGWAAERHRQKELYGPDRLVAADLLPTRYDRVAEALGAHGEYVERPDQLRPALERAFASGRPACVNVKIASIPSPSVSH